MCGPLADPDHALDGRRAEEVAREGDARVDKQVGVTYGEPVAEGIGAPLQIVMGVAARRARRSWALWLSPRPRARRSSRLVVAEDVAGRLTT